MRAAAPIHAVLFALLCTACAPTPVADAEPVAPATPAPVADAAIVPVAATAPDLSCKVAGDCEVKNVGNCCGYFPACVNADSPVDPEAVRAECARSGTSAACGFADIQACECVQGQCRASGGANALEVER